MHWFIAEIYISVSQTAKTILRKRTHEDDPERLAQDKQFEKKLLIARTLVIALAITNGVIYYFARTDPNSTFIFRANFFLGFLIMLMCLLVWGWKIYSLYSEISESKDVLPNIGVFATHAMLLLFFIILYLADTICYAISDSRAKENLEDAGDIL
jgi:cation transport ATPase